MLGKLFSKKDKTKDEIESLKERFTSMSGGSGPLNSSTQPQPHGLTQLGPAQSGQGEALNKASQDAVLKPMAPQAPRQVQPVPESHAGQQVQQAADGEGGTGLGEASLAGQAQANPQAQSAGAASPQYAHPGQNNGQFQAVRAADGAAGRSADKAGNTFATNIAGSTSPAIPTESANPASPAINATSGNVTGTAGAAGQGTQSPAGMQSSPGLNPKGSQGHAGGQSTNVDSQQAGQENQANQAGRNGQVQDFKVVEVIEEGKTQPFENVSLDEKPGADSGSKPLHPSSPSKGEEAKIGVTKVSSYLDDLKNQLDDSKLTSLIIQQVKELIEIDQNLNNKIAQLEEKLLKEIKERERLKQVVEQHYDEFKKNEKNMDKFIALYEVVTNQFNPFVEEKTEASGVKAGDESGPKPYIPDIPGPEEEKNGRGKSTAAGSTTQQMQPSGSAGQADAPGKGQAQADPVRPAMAGEHSQNQVDEKAPTGAKVNPVEQPHFTTKDGHVIKTLPDLVAMLRQMSSATFSHHVTEDRNDFASWVYHVIGNRQLAEEIGLIKNRFDMINAIMRYAK